MQTRIFIGPFAGYQSLVGFATQSWDIGDLDIGDGYWGQPPFSILGTATIF